jgi:exodeoxyribonuclease VII large subunit
LLDDVADLRASTPTDAAKRVVPDVAEELSRVQQARSRLGVRITHVIQVEIDRLAQLRSRPVLLNSSWLVDVRSEELTRYVARGSELASRIVERAEDSTRQLVAHLRALSPQRTLDRGYAIVQLQGGDIVRGQMDAPSGAALRFTLADGSIGATSDGPLADDPRSPAISLAE